MSGTPERKLTLGDLENFLGRPIGIKAEPAVLEADATYETPYLEAAAVLDAYDPFSVRSARGQSGPAEEYVLDQLLLASEQIKSGPNHGLWSLSFASRRAALRRLGTRTNMRRALSANPERVSSAVQRMFERVLDGPLYTFAELSRDELAALVTVVGWTEGILDALPDREQILKALTRADLLAPMRRLAKTGFVNRQSELQQLEEYVFANLEQSRSPLFVYGPGGVGKSTLLARFILVQLDARDVPFAYIDIDRPEIRPQHPLTILLDIATQLQQQLDEVDSGLSSLRNEIAFGIRREEQGKGLESSNLGYLNSRYFDLLRDVLRDSRVNRGAIVIIDTFEEAQFLGPDVVWPLLEFLDDLTRSLPSFRLILSGRDLPREFLSRMHPQLQIPEVDFSTSEVEELLEQIPRPDRPINVGVLDEEAARELLQRAVVEAGLSPLTDNEMGDVIGIVGQNPMTLKLAARLLREEGIEEFRESRNEWLIKLKAEKIQALLYGRILEHIHDENVRKVAYPGLIVRRITPEVVREVLAKPCGLELGEFNESDIFWELSKEAALVIPQPDDSLRHRPDVRRIMLADLSDYVKDGVKKQIHRAAVKFYTHQEGGVARAEEIYHRLHLKQSEKTLEERWEPEAAQHLQGALEELPAQQRLWLAAKLGATQDEAVRREADQEAWEDQVGRAAGRFIQRGLPNDALAMLRERDENERLPRSQLYSHEAEALRLLGRFDEALDVTSKGVERLSKAGAIDMALELQLKMAVIEEGRSNLERAEDLLDDAAAIAAHSRSDTLKLQERIAQLRLQRQLRPDAKQEREALKHDALALITEEMLFTLRSHPVLLREVAAELGAVDPRIARAAIVTLGLEVKTDSQAQALGQAIATLNNATAGDREADLVLTQAAAQFESADYAADDIRKWVTTVSKSTDARRIGQDLELSMPKSAVLQDFQTYFREGVNNALSGKDLPGGKL